jgi:hypothetical protein
MSSRKEKKKNQPLKLTVGEMAPRMVEMGFQEPKIVTTIPRGVEKMSDVMWDFIGPYLDVIHTEKQFRSLLEVAIAWDTSLLPRAERRRFLDSVVDKLMDSDGENVKFIIEELVRRKDRYFSHNRRMIVTYDLKTTRRGPHLSLVSTLQDHPVIGGDDAQL